MKNTLKLLIKRFARFVYRRLYAPQQGYGLIMPWATFAPWSIDTEFKDVYENVKEFTLVDKYRCYELWKLVEQSAKQETGCLIEIGVWRGGTAGIIATQAKKCGIKDTIFLFDTFSGVVKAGKCDSVYRGGEHSNTELQTVQHLLKETLCLDNFRIIEGVFPDETSQCIEDQRLRFCHIDVDVYESAKDITEWIWDRLITGGIIVYDDYGFEQCSGITQYVEEQRALKDRLVVHNLNGHAIIIKLTV